MRLKVRIQKALTENIPLKTAALIIAVILWLFVTSKGQTEVSLEIPLEFVNIPQGLDIVRHDTRSVNIVIRGYERFIRNLKPGDIRLTIDLSKARKGEIQLPIREEDIRTPFTISIIKIDPSSVRVVFEEKITKRVIVRPVITGRPDRDYYVSSIVTTPEEITIEGVTSELRRINHIDTEPLDITGVREDIIEEVGLNLVGKKIKPERDKVKIAVRIKRRDR